MSDQDAPPAKRPRVSSEDSDLPLYPQTPTRTPPFSLDEIASSPLSSPPPSSPLSPPSSVDRTLLVKLKLPVAQPIKEGEPQPLTFSVPARPIAKAKPASRRKAAPKTTQPKKPRAKKVQVKKEEVVNAQEGKPEPFGSPEIWADKRQQFCEALRWHRSLQKGAYTHDNIAYGLLIDKEVTIRDRFDDQIIITTVGGGRTQDESGKSKRTKNQDKSTTAVAFQRSQAKKIPIGVVAGQGNSISPSKLPYYYNVLGWFQVTDVWCEFVEGFSTWKIRLEKIDLCKTSWWAAKTAEIRPAPNFTEPKARSLSCGSCGVETKEMFNCGWTCLNRPCQNFFQFPDDVDQDKLDYNPAFLNERTSWTGEWPGSLSEPLPTKEYLGSKFASGTESEFFKGIVCPKCGICVRRRDWDQWTCENEKCDFVHELKPKAVPIADILAIDPTEKHSDPLKYLFSDVVGYSGPKTKGLYTAYRFTLPGDHDALPGYVTFYKSCKLINSQPDGPNDQFRDMQIYNFGMMRKPSRGGESAYGVLTRHWAANWGAPYKFSVAHDSKEFRHAPEVLIKALKRMTWAGKEALGDLPADAQVPFVPFNELLSVGYFETGKMDYHDDGEKTLGPTVSSISLGSSATMVFRPKVGSHIMGPGKPNPKGEKKDVLSFVLEHGDIMVMHGSGIHKHYEHKVTPHGKIRFALTSRHILIDKIPANEVDYANRATQLPAGSDRYNYDGDVNARTIYESPTAKEEIRGLFNRALTRVQLGETTMAEVDELYERLKQEMEQKTNAPAS
ncbi:hypothetical protein B0J14DRAFT_561877 [Halenospora varia]|nr:hypothetical protein B0J14DRAFT_561877 [Halenospora varia]